MIKPNITFEQFLEIESKLSITVGEICFYTGSNMCEIQVNGIYDSPTKAALATIEHTLITLIK